MSGLTRDETAERSSLNQIIRSERGQKQIVFPVQAGIVATDDMTIRYMYGYHI